jgi:lipoprotein-releasing system permease protein
MSLEFFIALRHLMSRERRKLISVITFISILGVIIGVGALIVVIAVMDGAQMDYFNKLIDQYAHVEVWEVNLRGDDTVPIRSFEAVQKELAKDPDVVASSPVIMRYALLVKATRKMDTENLRINQPAKIFGIDPNQEEKVTRLLPSSKKEDEKTTDALPYIPIGDPYAKNAPALVGKRVPGDGEIVVGRILANQMHLNLGDEIHAISKIAETANTIVPKRSRLRVVGIFKSGLFEADQGAAYVSLPTAQRICLLEDEVDFVHARLRDPYLADRVAERLGENLAQTLRGPWTVRSWGSLNPEFFKALFMEKMVMYVILMLIVLVAALNIIATLILVAMEKTRQIGILRAMGMSRRKIARIFVIEGAVIGVVGSLIGTLLGFLICFLLKKYVPPEWLPPAVYGLNGLPVLVKASTVLTINACSLGICLLASIIPALGAARLDIVEALRHE